PHLVRFVPARRQDQDRHSAVPLPERLEQPEAVQSRKHQVEDQKIRTGLLRPVEPGATVARDLDLVALDLQVVSQAEGEIPIVLDEEDAGHASPSAAAPERAL